MTSFFGKVLVIDTNFKFVESIKEEGKLLSDYPCVFCKTFTDATQILKQTKLNIRVVFISHKVGDTNGSDEFHKIRKINEKIPIVLVVHNPERASKDIEENNPGFSNILRGPKKFSTLTNEIDRMFTSNETWTDVQATQEAKDVELSLADESYISLRLDDFIMSEKSYFNVFIKIGPSKFVKILNAGDPLNESVIEKYSQKNFTHFYLSVEEHNKYLRLCEEIAKRDARSQSAESKTKLRNVINLGSNIAQSLLHSGINQEKLDMANTFLNHSVTLIKGMKMKNESLKRFIETIESKEHTATVSFLAGMIANEVGIESLKAIKIVGTAALLHDVGLYSLSPDFKEEDFESLSESNQTIFNQHPSYGADILRKNGGFDEVVIQAVEMHHMRRKGLNGTQRSTNMTTVAEIIGAADELHNIVLTKHADEVTIQNYMKKYLKNFSQDIERAVLKILNKKAT